MKWRLGPQWLLSGTVLLALVFSLSTATTEMAAATIDIPAPFSPNDEMDTDAGMGMDMDMGTDMANDMEAPERPMAMDEEGMTGEDEDGEADTNDEADSNDASESGDEENEDENDMTDQETDTFLESASRAAAEAGSEVMEGRVQANGVARGKSRIPERLAYMKNLRMEKLRRHVRTGGMLRRYAPELFDANVYDNDENDNVQLGSRASIFDAMNGPFSPLPAPHDQRAKINPAAIRFAMDADNRAHAKSDQKNKIRHSDDYDPNDPHANAYTYLPRNHRNKPFGYGKIFARARRDQALDIGPFEQQRYTNQYANPLLAFRGARTVLPLPMNPRFPFAEADAAIQGMRPDKLQQFPDFKPPPQWPSFAPAPAADAGKTGDAAAAGGAAAAAEEKED